MFGKKKRTKSAGELKRQAEQIEASNRLAEAKLRQRVIRDAGRPKKLASYPAATKTRQSADWNPSNKSANQAIIPDVPVLHARARSALRGNWAMRSAQSGFVRHIIGTGITPRAVAQNAGGGENTAYNRALDALWAEWAADPRAVDIEGRKTFLAVERLIAKELFAVGESIILPSYRERAGQVGLVLQMIEPEQLDSTIQSANGNTVLGGIEIDKYGAAIAYHVHTGDHPLETYPADSGRIPAERVLHVMDPERVRQTRGVTRMAAILLKARDAHMYDESELIAKRAEAALALLIKNDRAQYPGMGGLSTGSTQDDQDDSTKQNEQWNFEPFMVHELQPGQSIDLVKSERPNAQYDPYMAKQIAMIAAGCGQDYATVARDFSQGTFSSQRQGLLEMWAEHDPIQILIRDLALRPLWMRFVETAILEEKLSAPGFYGDAARRRQYLAAEWMPPAKQWIDPAKQAAAALLSLKMGLSSLQVEANKLGVSWRDLLQQRADLRDALKSFKLNLDWLAGTAGPGATPGVPKTPQGAGDEDQTEGSEGSKEQKQQGRAGGNGERLSEKIAELILQSEFAGQG